MKKLFNIVNLTFFIIQSFFTTIFTQAQDSHLRLVLNQFSFLGQQSEEGDSKTDHAYFKTRHDSRVHHEKLV